MFDREGFKTWAPGNGLSQGAVYKYLSLLSRIDEIIPGGVDTALAERGLSGVLDFARGSQDGVFGKYPSDTRSVISKYAAYRGSPPGAELTDSDDEPQTSAEAASVAFGLEKEMQAAVRRSLSQIESGLIEADGGTEKSVSTGRIDILARDSNGTLVVIELKAGRCPSSAIEQLLAYAHALSEETQEPIRTILVASEFSQKTLAAARWLKTVELKLYEVSVTFRNAISD